MGMPVSGKSKLLNKWMSFIKQRMAKQLLKSEAFAASHRVKHLPTQINSKIKDNPSSINILGQNTDTSLIGQ